MKSSLITLSFASFAAHQTLATTEKLLMTTRICATNRRIDFNG